MLKRLKFSSAGRGPLYSVTAVAATAAALIACGGGGSNGVGGGGGTQTPPPPTSGPAELQPLALKACESLQGMTVPASAIGLPTSGAKILSAARAAEVAPYADAEGEHLLVTPERCLVQGEIASIDSAAPPIKFAINLPLKNWNRRALQSGGGGLGGSVNTAPGNKASGRFDPMPVDAPYPITLGYVTFGSDGGHVGSDYTFTRVDEAMRNWAHEHLKKTRDVAIEVVKAAYGEAPGKMFFSGESAGGREAMIMAQKYPTDYDGVIATSPVASWNSIHLADNVLRDKLVTGFLDANAIKLVADRTRASCDALDGLRDGVVARYLDCSNDVAVLRCPDGNTGNACLSDAQIAAVNALRQPYSVPVAMANGVTRFPGFRVTGDEDGGPFQWSFYPIGTQAPSAVLPAGRGNEAGRGGILNFATFWVRHAIVQDDTFNPSQFDPVPYASRILYLSNLFDATDPDLRPFAAHGGKMILIHPSADNATPLSVTAEYYRKVVSTMGKSAADDVMRLYVGPGGSHNVGGTTQVDALSILENWALKGQNPPDAPTAYFKRVSDASLVRSMPACRYPTFPQYSGTGDPNQASSFTCTTRPDPMEGN